MSDTNRRIAEALGKKVTPACVCRDRWTEDELDWYDGTLPAVCIDGPSHHADSDSCWDCDHEFACHADAIPDYENDLNACLAVIRERWPETVISLGIGKGNTGIYFTASHGPNRPSVWGDTLADALLAALEADR